MHQQKENREIVEKALDLLGLNQSVTRRSFFKLSGITVVGVSALVSLGSKERKGDAPDYHGSGGGSCDRGFHEVRGVPAL